MAHGANIIDSRIRDARVPRYFPPLPSPVHPLLNAAITLKPIQRVLLPPLLPSLLPSFIVFYYRGCLEFRVQAILRGGIAIPCLSTIHSSFDRTMVVGRSLIGCIDVYRRPILGRSYRLIGGKREPRELEIGGTGGERRGGLIRNGKLATRPRESLIAGIVGDGMVADPFHRGTRGEKSQSWPKTRS